MGVGWAGVGLAGVGAGAGTCWAGLARRAGPRAGVVVLENLEGWVSVGAGGALVLAGQGYFEKARNWLGFSHTFKENSKLMKMQFKAKFIQFLFILLLRV